MLMGMFRAHFIDMPMVYIKYLTMHNVQMHVGKKVIVWCVRMYWR